jgi:hypothetical protein
MGLDMYLSAKRYISGYDHFGKEQKKRFAQYIRAAGLKLSDVSKDSPHGHFDICVAYWRKSNQVHRWFVLHVQEGTDDCKSYYVSKEQLTELIDTCKAVLANHTRVAELLPPSDGFFFGSTVVDEWYFEDLENTVKMLTPLVTDKKWEAWEFEYQSSW